MFVVLVMLKNNFKNSFFIDTCTRSKTSLKNFHLKICAQTCHSVSVLGHKQVFELAVPNYLLKI